MAGANKGKSVVNKDEIFMGSTKSKHRLEILPRNSCKFICTL